MDYKTFFFIKETVDVFLKKNEKSDLDSLEKMALFLYCFAPRKFFFLGC
jgi:hypothetical protein